MNNNVKKFLSFSRSERIAIIAIISVIIIMMVIKLLIINNPTPPSKELHDLDSIITAQKHTFDSIKKANSTRKAERLAHSFNKTSKTKRQSSPKNYEKKPEKQSESRHITLTEKVIPTVEVNEADTNMLKELPNIGSSFAKRIINYRNQLGGFVKREQIMEVFGMDSARYNNIRDYLVIDTCKINRLNINHLPFKELLRHPYLQYEDVRIIVNHREQRGLITSWEQLLTITGDSLNPLLERYIEY